MQIGTMASCFSLRTLASYECPQSSPQSPPSILMGTVMLWKTQVLAQGTDSFGFVLLVVVYCTGKLELCSFQAADN